MLAPLRRETDERWDWYSSGIGTKGRRVEAYNGVERPEVEVGIFHVDCVGAVRSRGRRAPGPRRGRAPGGGEADEAAAQGACGRPSHAALRRPWLSAAAACRSSTQEEWVLMFIRKVVNMIFLPAYQFE